MDTGCLAALQTSVNYDVKYLGSLKTSVLGGEGLFLASHVVVSGNVTVGERCFLGVNTAIRDNVTLGEGCVIGAGATVSADLADESVLIPPESALSRVPSSRRL